MDNAKVMLPTGRHIVAIDCRIYSLEAIKRALFDFGDSVCPTIEMEGDLAKIHFAPADVQVDSSLFKQAVADHQILIETERKYNTIRQVIIAQAFFPCENIEEIVEAAVSE